jgi:hypothetical protein
MPAPKRPQPEFAQIVKSLTRSGLDQKHVEELVDIVAGFGVITKRPKYFPWGQFGPDGVEVQTVFEPDGLDALLKLLTNPRIDSIEIFPRGIINPDAFSTRIRLR